MGTNINLVLTLITETGVVSRGWPMHVMGVQYWSSHHHYWTWAPPVADTLTTTSDGSTSTGSPLQGVATPRHWLLHATDVWVAKDLSC